jgi:hypothetical protein
VNSPMAIYDQGAGGQVGLLDWPVMREEVVPELLGTHRASAPSGWRIAFQVRIAERSGIPPVRARRSGGPVQDRVRSQDPETGSGSKRTAWALSQHSYPVT